MNLLLQGVCWSVLYTAYVCHHSSALSNPQTLSNSETSSLHCKSKLKYTWGQSNALLHCGDVLDGQCVAQHAQHNHSCCFRWFAQRLVALRHADGAPLCVLYGAHHLQPGAQAPGAVGQGPVVTFNMLRHDGSFFGYRSAAVCAVLCCAVLCCAVLCCAVLCCAVLC